MGSIPRVDTLEVDLDFTFQRREWALQRVGWVAMVLLILAALLGLTGRGGPSQATAGEPGSTLRVD